MKFSGLQKISLVDFPGKVASVLYTPGCNLRCPFCHNWRIVVDPKPPFLTEETAMKVLESRKRYVEAVVVTGGEPTIHDELPRFLAKLKERGFQVKLDTNGLNPEMLKECLSYVDFVAVDVKTSPEKYAQLGTTDVKQLLRTIEILKNGNVEYEFRTTLVPSFVDKEDLHEINVLIRGAKSLALQQFVPGDTLAESFRNVKPYPHETILALAESARGNVENLIIRA